MKRNIFAIAYCAAALLVVGCSTSDNDLWSDGNTPGGNGSSYDDSSFYKDSATGDDLAAFDIAFDTTPIDESETIPADESADGYEDYVENSVFNRQVTITYSDGNATVENGIDGVTVTQSGAHVTVTSTVKKVEYVLKGSAADGSFKIYSDNKLKLTLDGVTLCNPSGAAVNIQSKKRIFVNLAGGTVNTLSDGSSYTVADGEDMKGCFFSEGQLLFSGTGTLNVTGSYKHGICSDDYIRFRPGVNISVKATAGNGVKANDAVIINGGVLNIETTATASKGISCDGYMSVSGGRTTVITSGGSEYDKDDNDVSGCAGIKCDSVFTMTGGTLLLKSTGAGGKGLSTDQALTISGGMVKVLTTGKQYVYGKFDTSPKGIKSDADLTICGGEVTVRTTGGEGSEGIESKAKMLISGGKVEVSSYDDCLNGKTDVTISGGQIYAYSSNNDAVDSNGTLNISGGIIVCSGTQTPEGAFDCDQGRFSITGGTIVGLGGDCSTPTTSACTQPSLLYKGSVSAGVYFSLSDSGGSSVITFKSPRTYFQLTMLLSSPGMKQGSSYTLSIGGKPTGGTAFHTLLSGCTWADGTSAASVTLSSMVTSAGSTQGGMQGGGDMQPGGGGRR